MSDKAKLQSKNSWDSIVDDTSSLGYGSGSSSSTYSNWRKPPEASDFYKDAEFYDLDSVKSLCVDGFCCNDDCSTCNREDDEESSIADCSNYEQSTACKKETFVVDIDDVEPTEQLRRFSQQRVSTVGTDFLRSIKMLKLKVDDQSKSPWPTSNSDEKTNIEITFDEHIYEEIHYDVSVINLSGIQPPPLPYRNISSRRKPPFLIRPKNNLVRRKLNCDEQKTHL